MVLEIVLEFCMSIFYVSRWLAWTRVLSHIGKDEHEGTDLLGTGLRSEA